MGYDQLGLSPLGEEETEDYPGPGESLQEPFPESPGEVREVGIPAAAMEEELPAPVPVPAPVPEAYRMSPERRKELDDKIARLVGARALDPYRHGITQQERGPRPLSRIGETSPWKSAGGSRRVSPICSTL